MSLGQLGRQSGERRNQLNSLRRDYFRYLSQIRKGCGERPCSSGRPSNGALRPRTPCGGSP
ncbi:hypothetical protein ACFQX6_52785 [Streptosporangium lutulentum]